MSFFRRGTQEKVRVDRLWNRNQPRTTSGFISITGVSNVDTLLNRRLERLEGWVADNAQNPSLGTLPASTYVTNVRLQVTEAFNSDGADEIKVGYDADDDAYITLTDVSSTGIKTPTLGTLAGYNGTSRAVEAYYVNGGTEPTTGKAIVIVEFYRVTAEVA